MHRGTVHDDGGDSMTGHPTGYIYVTHLDDEHDTSKPPKWIRMLPFKNTKTGKKLKFKVLDEVQFEVKKLSVRGQNFRIPYADDVKLAKKS